MALNIRQPAVAGMFYPADPDELSKLVESMLNQAEPLDTPTPKAIIVPHAGYIYSGPVAATAYRRIRAMASQIHRVVLLGPSHRVPFYGIAASSASEFATPLGRIKLDRPFIDKLIQTYQVKRLDEAHSLEHSLEVHLPFLQKTLNDFTLVPLVVGDARPEEVMHVLESCWGGDETLIVISSDLSHYHDYATAQMLDSTTSHAIESLSPEVIQYENACGRQPLNGLLYLAREKGMHVQTLDLRNSGDTAGPRDQVVGYGAWIIH